MQTLLVAAVGVVGVTALGFWLQNRGFPDHVWLFLWVTCGLIVALHAIGWSNLRAFGVSNPLSFYVGGFSTFGLVGILLIRVVLNSPLSGVTPVDQPVAEGTHANTDLQKQILEQQKRLEFLQHRTDAVSLVRFRVNFDKAYSREELGKFQILLRVLNLRVGNIYISGTGPVRVEGIKIGGRPAPPGVQHASWSTDENSKLIEVMNDTMVGGMPREHIEVLGKGGPFVSIGSFDNAMLTIHVTQSLWPKIASVSVTVNDYVLFHQPKDCLAVTNQVLPSGLLQVDWPKSHQPWIADLLWVNVLPNRQFGGEARNKDGRIPRFSLDLPFSQYTPVLSRELTPELASKAIPPCD